MAAAPPVKGSRRRCDTGSEAAWADQTGPLDTAQNRCDLDGDDLQPLVNSFKETSTQTHGWPAYFGAVYLPAGGDKALLGEVTSNGLPGRLLQVFLDLPAAAALTRVKTVHDVRVVEDKARRAFPD